MDLFTILTILIVLSAIFGYINVRFLKLPVTIGLMIISIVFSFLVLLAGQISPGLLEWERMLVSSIDFPSVLLEGMLSFLLFAGSLHVDFAELRAQRWPIILFATLGVITSTFLIAGATYFMLIIVGMPIEFIYCLLFGALISPTDPIAVLGILKKAGVPKKLETKIVGESLFNDGIGVVVFLTIFQLAQAGLGTIEFSEVGLLFLEEVGGGILLGLGLGYGAYQLMKRIDDYEVEVMITLAAVMGGTVAASYLHVSAPLAMVVAGLLVGNERFRTSTMSDITETYVDKFWELMDLLFNAVLFVLIGLEIVVMNFEGNYVLAGILAIPIVLLSRYVALAPPVALFSKRLGFVPKTNLIMTWGGLRGGISIALALSLTSDMPRDLILTITYIIVVFSIIVQGLTVGNLVTRLQEQEAGFRKS
ncbi:cation:proton antiporter [Flavilitoribacter nigricans]|uniref:Sodium:proton antiporter n=1 Tax=Flavilitoribacter nigricans (strain ATCC 23147 / DSM 23189 / NBRC 102662 / NCIMB 1420 / SS-2) TaxID=1122177 RepID=A0A2D0NB28_FLAN2|nr:sodium:proton antiporter [Flavilitoribacter nigricans]PHN04973.1 sodium:proton antiporter [Flavilitoribacter nigricans DSM 23189 = NBRC 102662]